MQSRIDFSNKADSVLDCYPSNALEILMVVCDFFFFNVQTAQVWREQMVGLSGFQDKVTIGVISVRQTVQYWVNCTLSSYSTNPTLETSVAC